MPMEIQQFRYVVDVTRNDDEEFIDYAKPIVN